MTGRTKKIICLFLVICLSASVIFTVSADDDPLENGSHLTIEDGYVFGVPLGVTVDDVLQNFKDGATTSSTAAVTGMVVTYCGKYYTVVVIGDLNGDGKVSSTDYLRLRSFFKGSTTLSDLETKAADVTREGSLTSADYLTIRKHFNGSVDLYKGMNIVPDYEGWDGPHVKSLKIAGNSISDYVIVKQDGNDLTIQNAADNLKKYIKQATGIELEIKNESSSQEKEILVGTTSRETAKVTSAKANLVNHGYAIVADGNKLFLTGKDATGAMYAVYSFLEDYLGCRFYTDSFEVIHFAKQINIPATLKVSFSPKTVYRDSHWKVTFGSADFASKMRINSDEDNRDLTGYGEYVKYAGFVHTLASLAEMGQIQPGDQPCLTDETVYQTVLKNVRQWLRDNPDATIISVSQNDSYDGQLGCQCANCKAVDEEEGSPAGSLLRFVNRIADDIKDEFPNVYVDTLAYRYTRKAPSITKPRDNVIIRLCPIDVCVSHKYETDTMSRSFIQDFEDWSAICDKLYIWDYITDFGFYQSPFPDFESLYYNIQYFAEHNVVGFFELGNYTSYSGEFDELRSYLACKMMWNPDMTKDEYDALMLEFLKDYYGDGAPYIKEYIDYLYSFSKKRHFDCYSRPDEILGTNTMGDAKKTEFFDKIQTLFADALAATSDEIHDNVEKASIQVKYLYLFVYGNDTYVNELNELYDLMVKYNITQIKEGVGLDPAKKNNWTYMMFGY